MKAHSEQEGFDLKVLLLNYFCLIQTDLSRTAPQSRICIFREKKKLVTTEISETARIMVLAIWYSSMY